MQLNIDLHAFFTSIRPLFGNMLTQGQVNGCQTILTAWEASDQTDIRWLAYQLGTTKWETGNTMQPIAEGGHGEGHSYGVVDETGKAPYGRGDVQITFRRNYVLADQKLGLNGALAANYDLALQPDIAAQILIRGTAEGWFGKYKLGDFINADKCDYLHARQVVNLMDQATTIATYAKHFEDALHASITAEVPLPPKTPPISNWFILWGKFLEIWHALFAK